MMQNGNLTLEHRTIYEPDRIKSERLNVDLIKSTMALFDVDQCCQMTSKAKWPAGHRCQIFFSAMKPCQVRISSNLLISVAADNSDVKPKKPGMLRFQIAEAAPHEQASAAAHAQTSTEAKEICHDKLARNR